MVKFWCLASLALAINRCKSWAFQVAKCMADGASVGSARGSTHIESTRCSLPYLLPEGCICPIDHYVFQSTGNGQVGQASRYGGPDCIFPRHQIMGMGLRQRIRKIGCHNFRPESSRAVHWVSKLNSFVLIPA